MSLSKRTLTPNVHQTHNYTKLYTYAGHTALPTRVGIVAQIGRGLNLTYCCQALLQISCCTESFWTHVHKTNKLSAVKGKLLSAGVHESAQTRSKEYRVLLLSRTIQNHTYTPFMTVHLANFLAKTPYVHSRYVVLAKHEEHCTQGRGREDLGCT